MDNEGHLVLQDSLVNQVHKVTMETLELMADLVNQVSKVLLDSLVYQDCQASLGNQVIKALKVSQVTLVVMATQDRTVLQANKEVKEILD